MDESIHEKITYFSTLVSEAMFDDPLSQFFFPDEQKRTYLLPELFKVVISYGFKYGEAYITSKSKEGIAIVQSPENKKLTNIIAAKCGGLSLPFKVDIRSLRRILSYQSYAKMVHSQHAPDIHSYLMLIAVSPAVKGRGYGGALLKRILAKCDETHTACYLETQNDENVSFYEHFGFKLVSKTQFAGTAVTHYAMIYNTHVM